MTNPFLVALDNMLAETEFQRQQIQTTCYLFLSEIGGGYGTAFTVGKQQYTVYGHPIVMHLLASNIEVSLVKGGRLPVSAPLRPTLELTTDSISAFVYVWGIANRTIMVDADEPLWCLPKRRTSDLRLARLHAVRHCFWVIDWMKYLGFSQFGRAWTTVLNNIWCIIGITSPLTREPRPSSPTCLGGDALATSIAPEDISQSAEGYLASLYVYLVSAKGPFHDQFRLDLDAILGYDTPEDVMDMLPCEQVMRYAQIKVQARQRPSLRVLTILTEWRSTLIYCYCKGVTPDGKVVIGDIEQTMGRQIITLNNIILAAVATEAKTPSWLARQGLTLVDVQGWRQGEYWVYPSKDDLDWAHYMPQPAPVPAAALALREALAQLPQPLPAEAQSDDDQLIMFKDKMVKRDVVNKHLATESKRSAKLVSGATDQPSVDKKQLVSEGAKPKSMADQLSLAGQTGKIGKPANTGPCLGFDKSQASAKQDCKGPPKIMVDQDCKVPDQHGTPDHRPPAKVKPDQKVKAPMRHPAQSKTKGQPGKSAGSATTSQISYSRATVVPISSATAQEILRRAGKHASA